MDEFAHPLVAVCVDTSIYGLAALRTAAAEARRRRVPLHAIRCRGSFETDAVSAVVVNAAFLEALGAVPGDIDIHVSAVCGPLSQALTGCASDPRDLIVVGKSGQGALRLRWPGSVAESLIRRTHCPVLVVPAPEMARAVRERRHVRAGRGDLWEQFELSAPELRGKRRIDS